MPAVLIVCPVADELVPTRVDAENLDELDGDNVLVDCPDCGQEHKWTQMEAVISAATL